MCRILFRGQQKRGRDSATFLKALHLIIKATRDAHRISRKVLTAAAMPLKNSFIVTLYISVANPLCKYLNYGY